MGVGVVASHGTAGLINDIYREAQDGAIRVDDDAAGVLGRKGAQAPTRLGVFSTRASTTPICGRGVEVARSLLAGWLTGWLAGGLYVRRRTE